MVDFRIIWALSTEAGLGMHVVFGRVRDSLNTFLADFPTVSHEQAVVYLEITLEYANARVA